jgi:hypothetical protein
MLIAGFRPAPPSPDAGRCLVIEGQLNTLGSDPTSAPALPRRILRGSPCTLQPGTLRVMTEPAPTSDIELPPLSPERLAEIRELLAQVERGDYSDTLPWDQVADELGL